jgi:N-acetylglucosaminyl-diphospho-decaprenol L-rhamnosyltransferase
MSDAESTAAAGTVDVCVVTYNSAGTWPAMLQSLERSAVPWRLYVRDNGSSDATRHVLETSPSAFTEYGSNVGFAAAVNRLAAQGTSPYLLLLNPDTVLGPRTLERMTAHLEREPGCAAVAPLLTPPDGVARTVQGGWAPSVGGAFLHALALSRFFRRGGLYLRVEQLGDGPATEVDWLGGACLMVRRSAWEEVGGLSEHWFMYSEDIDLSRRLREHGWHVAVLNDEWVDHVHGESVRQSPDRRRLSRMWVDNLIDYYGSRVGRRSWSLCAFRACLALGFALRWLHAVLRGRRAEARKYGHWFTAALTPAPRPGEGADAEAVPS